MPARPRAGRAVAPHRAAAGGAGRSHTVTADTHTQVRSRLEGSRAAEPAVSEDLPGLGRPVRAGPVVRRVRGFPGDRNRARGAVWVAAVACVCLACARDRARFLKPLRSGESRRTSTHARVGPRDPDRTVIWHRAPRHLQHMPPPRPAHAVREIDAKSDHQTKHHRR